MGEWPRVPADCRKWCRFKGAQSARAVVSRAPVSRVLQNHSASSVGGTLHRYAVAMPSSDASQLLIGATAAVGRRLLARLQTRDGEVLALSRRTSALSQQRTRWLQRDLYRDDASDCAGVARVFSAGPLDGLAAWSARAPWAEGTPVVALSSLSAQTKAESRHPDERLLAQRLQQAEATLQKRARERGWRLRLLRVSLIYDPVHRQLSLDRLVDVARRLRCLPLPADATGLRQPVHADDLALAMLALAEADAPLPEVLRLPGGETLPFNQMVSRYVQAQAPGLRVRAVPRALARLLEGLLGCGGERHRLFAAQLRRSRCDLCIEASDWARIGLTPRRFLAGEIVPESLY